MSMSYRHYQAIADVLAAEHALNFAVRDIEPAAYAAVRSTLANVTRSIADGMAADNSQFKREMFYQAASLPGVRTAAGE